MKLDRDGDEESLDDIADQNDQHGNTRSRFGGKRRRFPRTSMTKGSLRAILARSKGRKQRVTLPNIEDVKRGI